MGQVAGMEPREGLSQAKHVVEPCELSSSLVLVRSLSDPMMKVILLFKELRFIKFLIVDF